MGLILLEPPKNRNQKILPTKKGNSPLQIKNTENNKNNFFNANFG